MGGNNNNKSGNDPRGRQQDQVQHQQDRYENQQGPMVSAFAQNYGRGSEANYGDYTDIMNNYRSIASGASGGDGSGGGGGGGGVSWDDIGYKDPFNSYAGYQEFSKTGGYSDDDMSNMRARGSSPIRAAYANAEREIGRQKSLQGGYAPNAIASRVRMAREQGQSMADASQNMEAGLAESRNQGRLAGLGGMSGIEGQRLGADLDVSKFNAQGRMQAQSANAAASRASAAQNNADRFRALSGMTQLYGTTPGMSELFGNQLLQGVGQGGNFGLGLLGQGNQAQQLPGAWDQAMGRVGDVTDIYGAASTALYPWLNNQNKKNTGIAGGRTWDQEQQDQADRGY